MELIVVRLTRDVDSFHGDLNPSKNILMTMARLDVDANPIENINHVDETPYPLVKGGQK